MVSPRGKNMAIGFVNDLLDKQGGAINKTAAKMAEVRKKATAVELVINSADQTLGSMDTDLPGDLPSLSEINTKLGEIALDVNLAAADVADLSAIGGSCLNGALGALNSMKKDAFGLVADGMTALADITGLPQDMIDLNSYFSKAKDMINNIGISDLIADINLSLGCLSSSSMITDVQNELIGLQNTLGLDASGQQDPSAYKTMMGNKLASVPGLDSSYKTFREDGMSSMAESASEMGETAKSTIKDSVAAAKNSVPKLPAPPSHY